MIDQLFSVFDDLIDIVQKVTSIKSKEEDFEFFLQTLNDMLKKMIEKYKSFINECTLPLTEIDCDEAELLDLDAGEVLQTHLFTTEGKLT